MGKQRAVRRMFAVMTVTGMAALSGAPAALAAEVNDGTDGPFSGTLFYEAVEGETNNLRITQDADSVLFDDDVPVTDASENCEQEDENVRCMTPFVQFEDLVITLGDGNDSTTLNAVLLSTSQFGGPGDDTLRGGSGDNQLSGGDGNDTLTGGSGDDQLSGDDGNDTLNGGSGENQLSGGNGNDNLIGGAPLGERDFAQTTMDGGAGADRFESNSRSDSVDYSSREAPVSVTLDSVANDGETGEGDNVLPGIDSVSGGSANDRMVGSSGDESFSGNAGDDFLDGQGGDDSLFGGAGNDFLDGQGGDDFLFGDAGNDSLNGGEGSDNLFSDAGADALNGGGGFDSVRYFDDFDEQAGRVVIRDRSVTLDGAANDGAANEGDNVASDIEDVSTDSGNDTLVGNASINILSGGAGNDNVTGAAGSDVLSGNEGDDTLNARDGFQDRVDCGPGIDRAVVDQFDEVAGCETVDRANVASAQDIPEDAPPTVSFIAPTQDAKLGATSNVTATASDDRGVAAVVLIDDGRVVGQDTTAPYSIPYTPTGDDVGRNTLVLMAIDTARQTATAVRPVRVDRFTPTGLTSRVSPKRDARIPYRFTTSGTLSLPGNVTKAQGCSGQVSIQIKAGKKTISTRRAKLSRTCTYRSAVRFTVRDRVRRGRLNVTVRYLGNDVLTPLRGRRQSVKVG